MIFSKSTPGLLSPKERNLYTKIFAGYLFNEFIKSPTLKTRLESFLDLKPHYFNKNKNDNLSLKNIIENTQNCGDDIDFSDPSKAHVNFDNHIIKTNNKEEPAEYADIGIWLPKKSGENHLIAIEAKYTQNWEISSDIDSNINRITKIIQKEKEVNHKYNTSSATFILLLSEFKIAEQTKIKNSVLNKYLDDKDNNKDNNANPISVCILSWDQIINMINEIAPHEDAKIVSGFYTLSIEQMQNQGRFRK